MKQSLIPLLFGGRQNKWALDLDFTSGVLDPRITFSRTTLATMFNSTGQLVYAPHNLITHSENLTNAAWVKAGTVPATVTGNAATDPFGGDTANLIDLSTSADARVAFTATAAASGFQTTFSAWLKALPGQSGTIAVQLRRADGTTPFTILTLTDQWQRFTVTGTASSGAFASLVWCGIRGSGGTLLQFHVWGTQLEFSTNAGPYVRTAGAPYHGPRFVYNPSTFAALGLLLEEARINSIQNSTCVGGVAPSTAPTGWTYQASTLTSTTTTYAYGIEDGMPYVDITMTGTNSTGASAFPTWTFVQVAAANGQTWAHSLFVRKIAGSSSISDWINSIRFRDNASTLLTQQSNSIVGAATLRNSRNVVVGTASNAATAFITCSLTATVLAGASVDITLRVALPQLELGAFSTSPIPTSNVAVSRAFDSAAMTGSSFSSWYNPAGGTFYTESEIQRNPGAAAFPSIVRLYNTSTLDRMDCYYTAAALTVSVQIVQSSTTQFLGQRASLPLGRHKAAFTMFTNDAASSIDGSVTFTDTSVILPLPDVMRIGDSLAGSGLLNGTIAALKYTPRRLSDIQLQNLSTI